MKSEQERLGGFPGFLFRHGDAQRPGEFGGRLRAGGGIAGEGGAQALHEVAGFHWRQQGGIEAEIVGRRTR